MGRLRFLTHAIGAAVPAAGLSTVEVDREYKGDVPPTVSVTTYYAASMCGLSLAVGREYLVFAYGDSGDGEVSSRGCDGTRLAGNGPPVTGASAAAAADAPAAACDAAIAA